MTVPVAPARSGGALLALGLATLAMFSPALLGGGLLSFRDLALFHEPQHRAWVATIRAGEVPSLEPGLDGGAPLLSNPNAALFYPGNVLYLLLPFDHAWNLFLAGHVLFAGAGMLLLLRRLGASGGAALPGALLFAFGGPLMSSTTSYTFVAGASWMPWVLAAALRAARTGDGVPLAASLAVQALAGSAPLDIATAAIVAAGLAAGIVRGGGPGGRRRLALVALAALGAALLLCGVQIVPALHWLPHTERGAGLDYRTSVTWWSLHPARLVELLSPRFFGDPMALHRDGFWGARYSDGGFPYIVCVYLGWLPLLALPLALRTAAGRAAAAVAALALAFALGHRLPGYRALYDLLPLLRLVRYPEKLTIVAQLGLAAVAGLGIDEVRRRLPGRGSYLAWAALIGSLVVAALAFPHAHLAPEQRAAQLGSAASSAAMAVLTALLLAGAARIERYGRHALGLLLALLAFADVGSQTFALVETRPREEAARAPALLARDPALAGAPILHLGDDQLHLYASRLLSPARSMIELLHPRSGLTWDVAYGAVDDVDRMGWRQAAARGAAIRADFPAPRALELLRRCGIARVVSLEPLGVEGLELEATLGDPGKLDPRVAAAWVYRLEPPARSLASFDDGPGGAEVALARGGRVVVRTRRAGALRVLRNAIPGWSATLDGAPAALGATPEGWLWLQVPEGTHEVELRFATPGLRAGAACSAAGLLLLAGLALPGRTRRSRAFTP